MYQTTIKQQVTCSGIGLHSGKTVTLRLFPAAENTGIIFHITTPAGVRTITPAPHSVIATGLATTLGKDNVSVSTVEHLLAAIRGLSIDNIHIEVDGGEIPIMDGSASKFVALINQAGTCRQKKLRKVLRIKKPVMVGDGNKSIKATPYNGFLVDYTISFSHPAIKTQRKVLDVTPQTFTEVAMARTFGFLKDVEALKTHGLALGGSLDNAIVLDEQGILNSEGLRYTDEFVRHKLLDFIGDMAMLELPLQGRFTVNCSGHGLNNEFMRHIASSRDTYLEAVTLTHAPHIHEYPQKHFHTSCLGATALA